MDKISSPFITPHETVKGLHHFSHDKVTIFLLALTLFGLEIFLVSGFSPSYVANSYISIFLHELLAAYWIEIIGMLPVVIAFEFIFLKKPLRKYILPISIALLVIFPLYTFAYRMQLWNSVFQVVNHYGAIQYASQAQTNQLPVIYITVRKDSADIRDVQSQLDNEITKNNIFQKYSLDGSTPIMAFTVAEKITADGQQALSPKDNNYSDYSLDPGDHLLLFLVLQPQLGGRITK